MGYYKSRGYSTPFPDSYTTMSTQAVLGKIQLLCSGLLEVCLWSKGPLARTHAYVVTQALGSNIQSPVTQHCP